MSNKGSAGLTIIVIALVVLVFIALIVLLGFALMKCNFLSW